VIRVLKLVDHPRLYVNAETAANLKPKQHSPFLKRIAEEVLIDADRLVRARPLREDQVENGYGWVTRAIDSYLQCLTAAWVLTRRARYRKAAIKHLAGLVEFNHISCEANHTIPANVLMPFCLSYGELCATAGLMYDMFRPDITAQEESVFCAVLDKFLMTAATKCIDAPPWWANKTWSNWNGVCAGGMGLMALAFYDAHPDAPKLIPFVEQSLGEYVKSAVRNGGGSHEGTGYWNYGMNYAMRYLLSWENATGRKHPAFKIRELGKGLQFSVDFTGLSFGDNDGWHPTGFFFMLAKRMKQRNAALNAAAYLVQPPKPCKQTGIWRANSGDLLYAADCIPTEAEVRKRKTAHRKKKVPVARVYRGLDWAVLADDEAFPTLRMSCRGGSSAVKGHGMIDLLSFRCRVNGQLMITDQQEREPIGTTFTGRGNEIYGRSAASKSTLFVDGLGCGANATCDKTETVKGNGVLGIRIDASGIYLPRWNSRNMFIGRLFLLVDSSYWLVIDSVQGADAVAGHWAESRFHTAAESKSGRNWVTLKSGGERMTISFANLDKGILQEFSGMPSTPNVTPTKLYRWMGADAAARILQVAALNPGSGKLGVKVREERAGYLIEVTRPGGKRKRNIRISPKLRLRPHS